MAQPKGTADNDEPLLRLSTLDEIRPLVVDDERYEFVNLDALPVRQRINIAEKIVPVAQAIAALYDTSAKPPSKAKERQIERSIDEIVRLLVPKLPDAVFNKLTPAQRQEIVSSFLLARMKRTGGAILQEMATVTEAAKTRAQRRSTGASTSRASNASTAARRKRGTTASRRRSSQRSS